MCVRLKDCAEHTDQPVGVAVVPELSGDALKPWTLASRCAAGDYESLHALPIDSLRVVDTLCANRFVVGDRATHIVSVNHSLDCSGLKCSAEPFHPDPVRIKAPPLNRRLAHHRTGKRIHGKCNRVMCELKESLDGRRVWVLNPRHATGGQNDDTGLRGVVPDAVRAD